MSKNLTHQTLLGLKWSYFATISKAIMQIGYTAVMARLLNQSDFGLVAMGGVVLRFGQYFAQMGMGSAIIQKKNLTKGQVNAAFTSSIILGFLFTVITYLLAPFAIYIFNNHEVIPLIKVMGVSFLINGFSLTALALIRRELRFKALAIAEIISFLIGYLIVGLGSAVLGFGVWSLVFSSITQSIILAIAVLLIVQNRLEFTFFVEDYKPLFHFGSKVSLINFLEFIGSSLDTILIGRFFGAASLGIYNRAQMLINLPMQYFTSSLSRVLFPSFSQIQNDNERVKKNIIFILQVVSLVVFPFSIIIAVLSKEIVFILLGPKWYEAVTLLRILSFAAAVNLLTHFLAILFEAKGILVKKIIIQILYIIILLLMFFFALDYNVIGFTIALTLSLIVKFIHYVLIFLREFKIKSINFIKYFIPSLATSIILGILIVFIYYIIEKFNINYHFNALLVLTIYTSIYVILLYSKLNNKIRYEVFKRLKLTRN